MSTYEISFDRLHELVAQIDYLATDTYPVVFTVDGSEYSCGIECSPEERQYLADANNTILDLQDPDDMEWDQIGTMLKEKCSIHPKSTIILAFNRSFSGEEPCLDNEIEAYNATFTAFKHPQK